MEYVTKVVIVALLFAFVPLFDELDCWFSLLLSEFLGLGICRVRLD